MYSPLWLDNGITIDASLTKVIATAPNGTDWSYIQKSQVAKVVPVYIPFAGASDANRGALSPFTDSAAVHIILTNGAPYRFDVQQVENQNTWVVASPQHPSGTAVTVEAGLNQAVEDISKWIST